MTVAPQRPGLQRVERLAHEFQALDLDPPGPIAGIKTQTGEAALDREEDRIIVPLPIMQEREMPAAFLGHVGRGGGRPEELPGADRGAAGAEVDAQWTLAAKGRGSEIGIMARAFDAQAAVHGGHRAVVQRGPTRGAGGEGPRRHVFRFHHRPGKRIDVLSRKEAKAGAEQEEQSKQMSHTRGEHTNRGRESHPRVGWWLFPAAFASRWEHAGAPACSRLRAWATVPAERWEGRWC